MPVGVPAGGRPDRSGDTERLLAAALAAAGGQDPAPATIGLAVSGGSDSLAMLHLMAQVAPQAGWALRAVTVDHRLRPEAAEEAAWVGRICAGLGVPHEVLVWDHGAITGNLMEEASRARYRLMADWARDGGIGLVTVAHTADDQAETFLMGLARTAGLDGLSGMRPSWQEAGVTFRRPFLRESRAGLRAYLAGRGLDWIEDPSNDNLRRTRAKARRALRALAPLGLGADRLAAVVENLAAAQGLVQRAVAQAGLGVTEAAGSLRFAAADLAGWEPEIRRRLVLAMIGWIARAPHAPRAAKLAALQDALLQGRDATLAGVRFRWQGAICSVSREARALGGPVPAGQVWDGRWIVEGAGEVRALGAAGLRQCPDWRATGLSRQVLEVSPGLWQGQDLIAAPCAGFGRAPATCAPAFQDWLLSH